MASRVSLIQSRSIYVGTANNVAPSDGNLIVTGNVGIGTTSPGAKLHVVGTESRFGGVASGYISVYNANSRSGYLQANEGSDFRIASDTNDMTFYVNGSERVRFTVGGNVGIGTTSPDTPLFVQGGPAGTGSWNRTATLSATYPGLIFNSNGTKWGGMAYDYSAAMRFWVNANNNDIFAGTLALSILNNGNVGIGTTAPYEKLDIVGNIRLGNYTDAGTKYIGYANDTFANQFIAGMSIESTALGGNYSQRLNFATHYYGIYAGVRMTLDEQGRLGIGTTSPGDKLQVDGTIWAKPTSNGTLGTALRLGVFADSASTAAYEFKTNDSTDDFLGLYSNRWGINYEIHRDSSAGDKYVWSVYGDDNGHIMQLYNGSNTNSVRLSSFSSSWLNGGNVGIGTTAPGSKLQVEGANPFIRVNNTSADDHGIKISYNGSDAHGLHLLYNANSAVSYIDNTYQAVSGQVYGNIYIRQNVGGTMTSRITIKADGGNVGIGTTSPTSKFTVTNGNVEIQSNGASSMTNYLKIATHTNGSWGSFIAADSYYNSTLSTNLTLGVSNAGSALNVLHITSAGNVGIGTTSPTQLLSVAGNTDLGNSIGSATSSTYTTRLSGYALYYDASNRYGNYGVLLLNADSGWTSSAKRFMITNGYNANRFAIIRSVDATTDPALGYGGSVTSGTVDFEINSAGAATFGSSVTTVGAIQSGGDIIIQNTYPRIQLIDTDHNSDFAIINNNGNFSIYDDTNSSHRLWIDSTGNVGIGTTSPSYKLDVESSVTPIHLNRTDGNEALIGLETQGTLRGYIGASSTDAFNIYNATPTRMLTVLSGGNVGIGTTTPDYKFEVEGVISSCDAALQKATFANVGSDLVLTANAGATNVTAKILFNSSGAGGASVSTKMIIDGSGNVGIGTTSPSYKLQVNSDAGGYGIVNTNGTVTIGTYIEGSNNYASFGTQSNHGLGFFTNNAAPQMYINTAGNVGIGTTSPQRKLHVVDTAAQLRVSYDSATDARYSELSWGGLITYAGNTNNGMTIGMDGGNSTFGHIYFYTGPSGSSTEKMRITQGGNVGIGTTEPDTKLSIQNDSATTNAGVKVLTLTQSTSGTPASGLGPGISFVSERPSGNILLERAAIYGIAGTDPNYDGDLAFYTRTDTGAIGVSEKVRITSAGNVGIGTTAPGARLEVVAGNTTSISVRSGNSGQYSILSVGRTSSDIIMASAASSGQFWTGSVAGDGWVGSTNGTLSLGNDTTGVANLTIKSGNVGIGTTAPSYKLQIAEDTYARIALHQTTTGAIWNWGNDGSNMYAYYTNTGVRALDITPTGNVGIGTTAPSQKLHVNGGNIAIDNSSDVSLIFAKSGVSKYEWYLDNASNNFGLYDRGNLSWRFFVTNAGNVGIGTTSPTEKLHVDGNAVLTYNNSYQGINSIGNKAILARVSPTTGIINYAEYATAANLNGFVMGSDDARVKGNIATDSLEFITNGSTQVTVLSNGDVGIGTTSPTEKLQVNGSLKLGDGNADGPQLKLASSGYSDWNIDNFSGSLRAYYGSTEYTRLTSSGNFGIGVTPSYKLDVAGDTRITSGSLGVGVLPDATDGRIDASNDIVAYSSSDRRLKENITPIANALDKVKSLTGVEFDWKPEHKKAHGYEGHDTGIIAQEVQEVMPTAVRTNNTGYLAVRYEKLIGLLIEANKELAARVEELEKKLK